MCVPGASTWDTDSARSTAACWSPCSTDRRSSARCVTASRCTSAWPRLHAPSPHSTSAIPGRTRLRQPRRRSACRRATRQHGLRHFSPPSTGTLHEPPSSAPDTAFRFLPALHPPDEAPQAALWFPFRGDRLLVRVASERAPLLDYAELVALGTDFERAHYLGRLDDLDCYTVELDPIVEPPAETVLEGLRALYGRLADEHYSIAGRAVQILLWDQTHRFCGRCGQPTANAPAERAKLCPSCGLLSFPRLSPAVIMLVQRGDEFLLARNRAFAEGFYSVLAGFVEPGESLEEAVSREVREEVDLELKDVRYFGSQPWPFPHSLMIGFTAHYASGQIRPQTEEIAEAAWFNRHGELPRLPGKLSIARGLIDWFLTESPSRKS